MWFLRSLREAIKTYGSRNIVYFDESGFEREAYRPHGWALRGKKVHGHISGNNRKSDNLIMAQRGKEWLAPMLFKGSCRTEVVNAWLSTLLLKELSEPSLIIMDNARFHNKENMREIVEKEGHAILPLPRYSPDFNPIEQSFATIKKRRRFSKISDCLESILMGNY